MGTRHKSLIYLNFSTLFENAHFPAPCCFLTIPSNNIHCQLLVSVITWNMKSIINVINFIFITHRSHHQRLLLLYPYKSTYNKSLMDYSFRPARAIHLLQNMKLFYQIANII